MSKKHVVIFADYYLPGYKAGGPIRSLSALITRLKDQYQFTIVTRNHDFGEEKPYEVSTNIPQVAEGAEIYYLEKNQQNIIAYIKLLKRLKPNVIYLNSFFSI